jgi:hypothetical protein
MSGENQQPLDRRESDRLLQQVLRGQEEIKELLKDMSRAFPLNEFDEPDYDGHRRAHQGMIQKAKDGADARKSAVGHVRNAFLVAAGALGLNVVWEYIKVHIK